MTIETPTTPVDLFPMETIDCDTIFLPGHDQGEPKLATEESAGYDLPAILSRAYKNVGKERFFSWQSKRLAAGAHDDVTTFLRAEMPGEIPKIKQMGKFPFHYLSLVIQPGETILVPLGIKTAFPPNKVALLYCRASSATKEYSLGNCVGVIDSDYRDEWFAAIRNHGSQPLLIKHGQAVVQVVFIDRIKARFPKRDTLPESGRTGGFGSTDPKLAEGVDPMGQLTGTLTRTEAANMAAGLGQMAAPPDRFEEMTKYDEPPPETEAAQAVRQFVGEATPEEEALLDAAIAAEERAMGLPPEPTAVEPPRPKPPAAPVADAPSAVLDIGMFVKVNGKTIEVGPIAKFRPASHLPLIENDGGKQVTGALLRDMQTLVPRAMPVLYQALKTELGKKGG